MWKNENLLNSLHWPTSNSSKAEIRQIFIAPLAVKSRRIREFRLRWLGISTHWLFPPPAQMIPYLTILWYIMMGIYLVFRQGAPRPPTPPPCPDKHLPHMLLTGQPDGVHTSTWPKSHMNSVPWTPNILSSESKITPSASLSLQRLLLFKLHWLGLLSSPLVLWPGDRRRGWKLNTLLIFFYDCTWMSQISFAN